MNRRYRRAADRTGSVNARTINGQFQGYKAVIPVYHPVTDQLVKRVYGYGPTESIAVKRRNQKAFELMTELGTLTNQTRQTLDAQIKDDRVREEILTLGEYSQKWLKELELQAQGDRPTIREATIDTYRSHIDLHIVRHLGHYRLNQLTANTLSNFFNLTLPTTLSRSNRSNLNPDTLRKAGKITITNEQWLAQQPKLSPKTIKHIRGTLNQILTKADSLNLIEKNPLTLVQLRTQTKQKDEVMVFWGEKLLQNLPTLYPNQTEEQLRWHLGILGGLRQSEVLGLTEDRFLLNHPTPHIVVQQTLALDTQTHGCGDREQDGTFPCGNTYSHQCPKKLRTGLPYLLPFTKASRTTHDGVRRIPLPASTLSLARQHLTALQQNRPTHDPLPYIGKGLNKMNQLVFTLNNGKARRPKEDNKRWHKLIEKTNTTTTNEQEKLPANLRQHTTRKICATVLSRNGVSIEIAKQILGHSNELMTEFYTTRSLTDLSASMSEIDHSLHTGDSALIETGGMIATSFPQTLNFSYTPEAIKELQEADAEDTKNLPE